MKIDLRNSDKKAIINENDFQKVVGHIWMEKYSREYDISYAFAKIDGKNVFMHRLLMDLPSGHIDHIDGDGLNNSRENLRLCTVSQNQMNRRKRKCGTSKYKGVYWENSIKKWKAEIYHNGQKIILLYSCSENAAAEAYNLKAKELFGEFAKTNIVTTDDRNFPDNYTKRIQKPLSSKYKGVSLESRRAHQKNKWVAHTRINGKRIKIGRFATEEMAKEELDKFLQNPVLGFPFAESESGNCSAGTPLPLRK